MSVLSASEPSSPLADALAAYLDVHPKSVVRAEPRWRRNSSSLVVQLDDQVCELGAEGTRCRAVAPDEARAFESALPFDEDWSKATDAPPEDARELLAALNATRPRSATVRRLGGFFEVAEAARRLVIADGATHRVSDVLPSALEVPAQKVITASSLFADGAHAWGVVLVDGDQGNGNNASGFFNALLVILVVRDGRLQLAATHPLGGWGFARFVGDDGFHQSSWHALLCPSVSAGVLDLVASCPGQGDPRSFGAGPAQLCELARAGRCAGRGSKSDPAILAGAGKFVLRGTGFVRAELAKAIRPLEQVKPWRDEAPGAAELFVSERPWAAKSEDPVEWLEVENRTARAIDLQGLELGPHFEQVVHARVAGPCVVAPRGVVTLRRGQGPSWNAKAHDCYFGDVALTGAIRLAGPAGTLATSWDASGLISGYSLHCGPATGCQLARESPGTRDAR